LAPKYQQKNLAKKVDEIDTWTAKNPNCEYEGLEEQRLLYLNRFADYILK